MGSPFKGGGGSSSNPRNLNQAFSNTMQGIFSTGSMNSSEKSAESINSNMEFTGGASEIFSHPTMEHIPPESSNSNQGKGNVYTTDMKSPSPDKVSNTSVSHSPINIPNSNGGTGGNPNLFTLICIVSFYLWTLSSGNGGSVPPSLPGSSLGPPIQPPPMGTIGVWSSFMTNLITALMAYIGNLIKVLSKNKIVVDNPNLAVITTAVVGVYLLRKKGILVIIGFLLVLLSGYLLLKLKISMPTGVLKLLQGGSTGIVLSSETIVLAIAFTVTVTAACIVSLVISITKKD
jgi:hypothetical protein